MEEPENNLSHTNMSVLVSKLARNTGKQLFISTHSSYVANKLGLNHLHLVGNGIVTPLSGLEQDTYNYFLKLPGYNTLRLLLANNVILVEGPADELIVQRAYLDEYSRLPIEDGIDVIAVGGVAFKRYCELAMLVEKKISIIHAIDRKIALDDIAESQGIEFDELLDEIESIVYSGTKININYFLNEIMDEDKISDIFEYFRESESDDINEAIQELGPDYSEDDIRLVRIKFLSELGN